MKPRTEQIIYWIVTLFFALMMMLDGIAGVLRVESGKAALAQLGFPEYCLSIFGIAKIFGSIAILQTIFSSIKEWAYAGFTFMLIGAFASHVFVGSGIGFLVLPIILLAIMSSAALFSFSPF